tara:strand:+ start:68549 stop:69862 length:1314 start_codon:yes stop_codon:yes gene_type:complete
VANINPLRELPTLNDNYKEGDVLVIFGEVFDRGYVNGLVKEAEAKDMQIIYATVGRRDEENNLRSLTEEEISAKGQEPLINIPLEAGFDLEAVDGNPCPADMLKGVKLKGWQDVKIDFDLVRQSQRQGRDRFEACVDQFLTELDSLIPDGKNVLFAHTMAGGVPRTKIVMPLLNRVFKGHGDRYQSSEELWNTDIGKLIAMGFEEVSATTFQVLIDRSESLRKEIEATGQSVAYVAYGYHGTELSIDSKMTWQSYAPYLTGFAKLKLEEIAERACQKGVNASVYNVPEILTNSSSMFQGIEIAIYPLLRAMLEYDENSDKVNNLIIEAQNLLKDDFELHDVFDKTDKFFSSSIIRDEWSKFDQWPQHNGPEQMELLRNTSSEILDMHKDTKDLLTGPLSEVVFSACGHIMLNNSWSSEQPVYWIGHDIVAKYFVERG